MKNRIPTGMKTRVIVQREHQPAFPYAASIGLHSLKKNMPTLICRLQKGYRNCAQIVSTEVYAFDVHYKTLQTMFPLKTQLKPV